MCKLWTQRQINRTENQKELNQQQDVQRLNHNFQVKAILFPI